EPEIEGRQGARRRHPDLDQPSDSATGDARGSRADRRCGQGARVGAPDLLPGATLEPFDRLAPSLRADAGRRPLGLYRRDRRHGFGCAGARDQQGRAAGRGCLALSAPDRRTRRICGGSRYRSRRDHRQRGLAAGADRAAHRDRLDRKCILLSRDVAGLCRRGSFRCDHCRPQRGRRAGLTSALGGAFRRAQYSSQIQEQQEVVMTHILHRVANAKMPVAVGGRGIELFDQTGKAYIDASGGAAVSCLGHGHPDVIAALHRQLDKLAYAHTGFFTTEIAEKLADRLIETAPKGIDHVYLVSGGSEAIEAALKMARQYFVEKGEPQRRHIIARRQSYHGNTLGALATGGNEWRRAQFRPLLIETHHIDPCYAYRLQDPGESDVAYAARAAQALEDKILELGSDQVMAFVAETVVGATSGAVPPVADYFKRIRAICDRYGVLLILDEVMCGMGRTGTLHACEQDGIAPDLLVIAKGLGGGYQPVGAVLLG